MQALKQHLKALLVKGHLFEGGGWRTSSTGGFKATSAIVSLTPAKAGGEGERRERLRTGPVRPGPPAPVLIKSGRSNSRGVANILWLEEAAHEAKGGFDGFSPG